MTDSGSPTDRRSVQLKDGEDHTRVAPPETAPTDRATAELKSGEVITAERTEEHTAECDCVLDGHCGGYFGWVEHEHWNDADVCTCYLKDVMARRAVYGDERLIAELPFPAQENR